MTKPARPRLLLERLRQNWLAFTTGFRRTPRISDRKPTTMKTPQPAKSGSLHPICSVWYWWTPCACGFLAKSAEEWQRHGIVYQGCGNGTAQFQHQRGKRKPTKLCRPKPKISEVHTTEAVAPAAICSPRPTVARTDGGEEFHDPRRVYALAEDAECLTMWLDAAGVPKEENGNGLSLWGRVQRYARIVANETSAGTDASGNTP